MKKYIVTLVLVTGYNMDEPKTSNVDYEVEATNAEMAKEIAKEMDDSKLSIYDSYATEI